MELAIIADSDELLTSVTQEVRDVGFNTQTRRLMGEAASLSVDDACDARLVACSRIDASVSKILCQITSSTVPVILLMLDTSDEAIKLAVESGCAVIINETSQLSRLPVLTRIATYRHKQNRALLNELTSIKITLENRKLIERAKGIIMKQRHLDEDSAYRAMRKLAMDNNQKMHEVASQILTAAEVLT